MSDHLSPTTNNTLAILAHIIGLLTGFLGPLIMYLIYKDEDFNRDQIKEALNFQITVIIGYIISFILMFVFIGFILAFVIGILDLIFCIMGAIKASNWEYYRYPVNIRFIK